MIDPKEFYDALVKEGLDFFCGVPDSLLKDFCACVFDNAPEGHNVIAANEGSAVGMACGYHVATGKHGVVYMQNSGEGNAVNPLLSIADPEVYGIPMLLVIGWRGEPGVHDEPQHVKQGKVTLPLLEAMGIEHLVLDASWRTQLERCCDTMRKGRTVALVVRKGVFDPYAFNVDKGSAPLTRERALELALSAIGEGDFVVSTTGKTSREVFEIREARGQGHAKDFLTVGGMGHTGSIAFGMACGMDRNVWCIDGDGSFLMHMGSLAVVARNAPGNFKYVLNNNGAHESVGGQPTVAQQIDVPGVLRAFGFEVFEARTEEEVVRGMASLERARLGALVVTTRQGSRPDLGRPTASPWENKLAMMEAFGSLEKLS